MNQEFEMQRKLYGSYMMKCDVCQEVKHRAKFKRFNAIHKVCNDCINGKGKDKNV